MKKLLLFSIACALGAAEPVSTNRSLTLDQALELAERLHPELAEGEALIRAAQGRADYAGRLQNPDLIGRVESTPINGRTAREAEFLAGASQVLPLGRRLSKARSAERLLTETRIYELELRRRDIRKRVRSAFATALYQEKAFLTLSHITETFERAAAVTKARVDAGDALPEDLARAELELIRSKVERDTAAAMRQTALGQLATAIGDRKIPVTRLDGNLDVAFEIPTIESIAADLGKHPAALRAEADFKASAARLELAKAQRIPDITVEALYRRLEAEDRNAFDMGVSIPLPLFDRNTGRVRETRAESAAAEAHIRSTQNNLWLRTQESHSRLTSALSRSRSLRDDVLPRAKTILETVEKRYSAGDVRVTDLLSARRDWASMELSYLESLRDVAAAWAEISFLLLDRK